MSATSQDLNMQIAEAERRRREALDREQARQLAESANAREIEQADSEIRRLQVQRDSLAFQEMVAVNGPLIEANKQAVEALYNALNSVENPDWWAAVEAACARLDRAFRAQYDHRQSALAMAQSLSEGDFPAGGFARGDLVAQRAFEAERQRRYGDMAMRVYVSAVPVAVALTGWVAAAPNLKMRRRRQGITFALIGQIVNPDAGWTVEAALKRLLDQRGY